MSSDPDQAKKESAEETKNEDVKTGNDAPAAALTEADAAESNNGDPSDAKEPLDEKVVLQARRKLALEALCDAEDLPSVVNLLELVNELHEGFQMHPTAVELVAKATVASEYLMYKSVVERLTRPRSFGGLAWAESKAKQIADRLFETMGRECCAVDVSENKLIKKGGQDKTDARRILTHLIAVGEEIQDQREEIRNKILQAPESELERVAAELAKESEKVVITRPRSKAAPTTPPTPASSSTTKSPRSAKKRKPEIPLAEDLGDGKRSMRSRRKVDYGPLMH